MTRALVADGADVLSITETRHSLEDVYLELVAEEEDRSWSTRPGSERSSAWSSREIRHNKLILVTACILPIIFLVELTVEILLIEASATSAVLAARVDTSLFVPLLVPVLIPATMSAFSVVGEREQGTLEPVLTTPVTRVELIVGKAAAIFMPAVSLSYVVLGVFVAIVALFARSAVAMSSSRRSRGRHRHPER